MPADYSATTSHKFLNLPNRTLWVYNLYDCHTTARIFFALRKELQDPQLGNQWKYYQDWVQPLQTAVMNMQRRGILLDRPEKRRMQTRLSKELTATDNLICRAADEAAFPYTDTFPNSREQVGKLLFEHLALRGGKKTAKTNKFSGDKEALTRALRDLRVRDKDHTPLLHNLFHRVRLATIRSKYFDIPVSADDRVRAVVKMTGTKTFRYAYAEPALQQYPPETRRIFRARPGHLFVSADYAQLEARILALLSADDVSLGVFERGEDVHDQNTMDLFGMQVAEWDALGDKAESYRNYAKAFLYKLSYGGSAYSDSEKLYCPCPRCADFMPDTVALKRDAKVEAEARWFQSHPAVARWQADLGKAVRQQHYYESPFGVRRMVAKPWGAELEREVKNIPMQMNGALLMNQRQVRMDRMGLPIVLQHHDSFMLEVEERDVGQVVADVRGAMEEYCPELGHSFPTDVSVGLNWGKRSEGNLEGLGDA